VGRVAYLLRTLPTPNTGNSSKKPLDIESYTVVMSVMFCDVLKSDVILFILKEVMSLCLFCSV
jgi:hypothetical protein